MDREATFAQPDYLLDTAAINAKYASRADNPRRFRTGVFRVPFDCVGGLLRGICEDKAKRFVSDLFKQGWELEGNVQMGNPRVAHDEYGLPDLSEREITVCGVFKFQGKNRIVSLELDPASVKQAPDHVLTVAEARKAWGHV